MVSLLNINLDDIVKKENVKEHFQTPAFHYITYENNFLTLHFKVLKLAADNERDILISVSDKEFKYTDYDTYAQDLNLYQSILKTIKKEKGGLNDKKY